MASKKYLVNSTLKKDDQAKCTGFRGTGQKMILFAMNIDTCYFSWRKLKHATFRIDDNGCICLKGRRGRRIKRYGTKLCLTNLENHVQQLDFIESCKAIFMENKQSLHLYFTVIDDSASRRTRFTYERDVSRHVRKLADVYRPDEIALLNRFELTTSGKICEKFLKKYAKDWLISRAKDRDKLDPVAKFRDLWKSHFPCEENLGFLDSGGSSIVALRIANELEEISGLEFPQLVGNLLRNESMSICQDYILERMSNEKKSFDASDESLGDYEEEKKRIIESSERFFEAQARMERVLESEKRENNSENMIPWQKCRGRGNFPIDMESIRASWIPTMKIRLGNRYYLGKCVDASPTIFSYPAGGKNYVTVGSHAGLVCTVELSEGNSVENWTISLPDRIEASVLVIDNFRAIVGSYDSFVYCIHLKTGQIFWKFKTSDIVKCTAVLCSRRENIFFGSYDRKTYCVSLKDGSEVWSVQPGNGGICATPCINDDLDCVLFASLDGTCVSLDQKTGEQKWLNKFDHPVFSAPVVLDTGQAVFAEVSGKLNSVCLTTGQKLWSVKIHGNIFSHLVLHTDLKTRLQSLIFGSENGNVYRMECVPGTGLIERFERSIGGPIVSTPSSDGKVIVAACNRGTLKILDFVTGKTVSSFKLGGDVFSSPMIHDRHIVVGCRDDYLYVLSIHEEEKINVSS